MKVKEIFKLTIIIFILSLNLSLSKAQESEGRWEFGVNMKAGLLMFEKTDKSMYDKNQFTGRNSWTAGGGLVLRRVVSETFNITTGLEYRVYNYRMKHGNLGFSNQLQGQIDHYFDYNRIEIPILFVPSLEVEEGWMVDLIVGPSMHFNFLTSSGFQENGLQPREGSDAIDVTASYNAKSSSQFMASVNFGVSVYNIDKKENPIKIVLLYERGIFTNKRIDLNSSVTYQGNTNNFSAALEPVMSSLTLGIYYFPKFLNKK
jgi:hypothetical protein